MKRTTRRICTALSALVIGSTTALAANTAQAASTVPHVAVPATIASDCSVDVTADLNSYFKTLPNNVWVDFPENGCYEVDGTLKVVDKSGIDFHGHGSTFKMVVTPAETPKYEHETWRLIGGDHIQMRNMIIEQTNPSGIFHVSREWYSAITVEGTSDVFLTVLHGKNLWGDFVGIGHDKRTVHSGDGAGATLANHVILQNSDANIVGRNGVSITGADDVLVQNSAFNDVGYQVWDLEVEGAAWHARNITFSNNTIGGAKTKGAVFANGGMGTDDTNITLTNNVQTSTPVSCSPPINIVKSDVTPKSNYTITGNTFRSIGLMANLANLTNSVVDNNTGQYTLGGGCGTNSAAISGQLTSVEIIGNHFEQFQRLLTPSTQQATEAATTTGKFCDNWVGPNYPRPVACQAS